MYTIGITGGVGAGKSEVLKIISESCRCRILKADDLAKELQQRGHVCHDRLIELLGTQIIGDDGEIDRAKMAAVIFNRDDLLDKVNGIVHPEVKREIIRLIGEYSAAGDVDFFFIEAALLIEDGYELICDELWYIYATEEVRRKRLIESRGYSEERISGIIKSQLSDEEFRAHCIRVIDNSDSIDNTRAQVEREIASLLGEK